MEISAYENIAALYIPCETGGRDYQGSCRPNNSGSGELPLYQQGMAALENLVSRCLVLRLSAGKCIEDLC